MPQTFSGQRKDEEVLLVFRRHILTIRKGLYVLFVTLLIGFIPLLIWPNESKMIFAPLTGAAIGLLCLAYYYMLWYFSVYIVTNERIRQVQQKGLFQKTVVDLSLFKVDSISYSVPGFFGGICGYGTIIIQTVVGDLIISYADHPEKIYNKLQNVIDQVSKRKEENGDKETI